MSGDIICGGFIMASMMQYFHCLPPCPSGLCSLPEINYLHCPLSQLQYRQAKS